MKVYKNGGIGMEADNMLQGLAYVYHHEVLCIQRNIQTSEWDF